jgi:hypothetical protein
MARKTTFAAALHGACRAISGIEWAAADSADAPRDPVSASVMAKDHCRQRHHAFGRPVCPPLRASCCGSLDGVGPPTWRSGRRRLRAANSRLRWRGRWRAIRKSCCRRAHRHPILPHAASMEIVLMAAQSGIKIDGLPTISLAPDLATWFFWSRRCANRGAEDCLSGPPDDIGRPHSSAAIS